MGVVDSWSNPGQAVQQTVADSTTGSVSEPLSYQETFAVMEIFLLLHAVFLTSCRET